MHNNIGNNRTIVKNTMVLYFRMLLLIFVGLYTSRVILQVLGVEDLMLDNHLLEIRDSCSAIAGLEMLKKELNGEVEY